MNIPNNPNDLTGTLFHAMNSRDFELFEQIITDEVVFDFPGIGRVEGRRKTLLVLKSILRRYPKLHFTVSQILSDGECACAVWTNEGEANDGVPYSNSGITLVYFTDGKISFISDYFKDTSFTQ